MKKLVILGLIVFDLFAYPALAQVSVAGNVTVTRTTALKSLNTIRFADQFPGADCGARITAASADLPLNGGSVWDFEPGACAIPATINVGNVTRPVTLNLGYSIYICSVSPCFLVARNSSIIGSGVCSATVIQGDGNVGRILIRVLDASPGNPSGELNITLRDFELRLSPLSDTGIDAAFMENSLVQNVNVIGYGAQSTGTCLSMVSADGNNRNYRNDFISLRCSNMVNGVILTSDGVSNGPNGENFYGLKVLGTTNPVAISRYVYDTALYSPDIETCLPNPGTCTYAISNAGTDTAIFSPFFEATAGAAFTSAIQNTSTAIRLRVINPSWGGNLTSNVTDTGIESYCERCGGSGPGNSSSSFSSGTGKFSFGNSAITAASKKFDVVNADSSNDGMSIRNTFAGGVGNIAKTEYWLKNSSGTEINYGYFGVGSAGITHPNEQSTIQIGCVRGSDGATRNCLSFLGTAATFDNTVSVSNTAAAISSGTGAVAGACSPKGSIFLRTDGGAGSTLYVCEGNWAAK